MIATTIEQSKKLVELGIDISTADMCWCNNSVKGVNYTDNYALHTHTVQELKSVFDEAFTCWDKYWKLIPAWSLGALLEVMPNAAMREYNLVRNSEECYIAFDDVNKRIHENYEGNTPLEAAYNMVVWLLKNGYIESKEV